MSTTSPELVVLVGNPRAGSRTRAVAEHVASFLPSAPAVVLDLAELAGVSWTSEPGVAAQPVDDAVDLVRGARHLVVATPSYKGTYTGLLKLFFDRFPHLGLEGVAALPIAVAASPAHATATADDLTRLLRELGAHVTDQVPLLESHLDGIDVADAVESLIRAGAA